MDILYPFLRTVHISAALASGALFAARGFGLNVLGLKWMMAPPLRYGSYIVDTVLLVAAIALAVLTRQYPFIDGWLTTKVALLVVYIVLGTFALKRGRTRATRLVCWCAAMVLFTLIVGVARARDPLGWFAG
ncbi:MAG TPA: SirB2 family protein [Hyphomonadaceae bacterium]|nr:SirB2 family protein [Hyphomonadaceae bacterium]